MTFRKGISTSNENWDMRFDNKFYNGEKLVKIQPTTIK